MRGPVGENRAETANTKTTSSGQSGDALFISGRVKTFYHKQLAQELVRHVADGVELINAVDVS